LTYAVATSRKLTHSQDQGDVDSHAAYGYQPGHEEDPTALWLDPAVQLPILDQSYDTAAPPQSAAPPSMYTPYDNLFAPVESNMTLLSNAPQIQAAPPSRGPPRTDLLATQSSQQPPQTVSAIPPLGVNPLDYLTLVNGRPSQGLIWPVNVDIGIVEICTFCPSWFKIPEVAARAVRNEWTREELGKVQLHAIGALGWDEWLRAINRIQKQVSAGCKLIDGYSSEERVRHNSPDFRRRYGPQDDLTATAWQFKAEYEPGTPVQTGHVPLSDIYEAVVNWPVDNDRLIMTQCLEFAKNNEHLDLDTSHWDWIIRSQGLTAPPAPVGLNRDVDAYQRLNASVANPETPRV
jgi:hypothetical protein